MILIMGTPKIVPLVLGKSPTQLQLRVDFRYQHLDNLQQLERDVKLTSVILGRHGLAH